MKKTSDVVALVIDSGYNVSLAETLAEKFGSVFYYSPCEMEFHSIEGFVLGDGLDNVERVDEVWDPAFLKGVDLVIFPDIGYSSWQKQMKAQGKAVWGSFDATNYELSRTKFIELLKSLDLPMAKSVPIRGVRALYEHLKGEKDKWVKIDRFRNQKETFRWIDLKHSRCELEDMACKFGGLQDLIGFVVQDPISTDIEIGFDGWTVDGKFPSSSYAGFESKNESYIGSVRKYSQLAEEVRFINQKMSSTLRDCGYRNFMASEIRVRGKTPFWIDPTFRLFGQTGEQLQITCGNLAHVIWHGANGELIDPKWDYNYALSITMHYTGHRGPCAWKQISAPPGDVRKWVKPAHYCEHDGMLHFPPHSSDELGVIISAGKTIPEAFARLKKTQDALKDEPISYDMGSFFDLLDSIREAEKKGMKFSDQKIPTKEEILKFAV